jgi:TonB family protein
MKTYLLTYLLNALWQTPLVFAAAWAAYRVIRRTSLAEEHSIWCGALIVQVILPACQFNGRPLFALFHRAHGSQYESITINMANAHTTGAAQLPSILPTLCLIAFGAITLYFIVRLLWALYQTSILRRYSTLISPAGAIAPIWHRCASHFEVHNAQLSISSEIPGPITIGIFKRLLILPATWLESLPSEDLDAAIAHEFAHMRRHDFAKNLAYQIVSLPIAWHPIVWLMRSRIAETREILCDALAAQAVAGKQQYARSLLRLASGFAHQIQRPATHAIGIFDTHNFERRIMKLTQPTLELRGIKRVTALAACALLGFATAASALALRVNVALSAMQADAIHKSVPGSVMAGQVISRVNPIYPPAAKKAKIQGTVVLEALIGKDGTIKNLRAVSGPPELLRSALDSVRTWKYKPYLLNGNPTEVKTEIKINYSLKK